MPQLRMRLPRVKLDVHSHILDCQGCCSGGSPGFGIASLPGASQRTCTHLSMLKFVQPQHRCNRYRGWEVKARFVTRTAAVLLRWQRRWVNGLGLYLDVVPIKPQLVDETLNTDKVDLPWKWLIPLLLLLTAVSECKHIWRCGRK